MAGLVCNTIGGVIIGGIGSGIFASFMNATGIAKSVAKTTAPLFKNAFYYGAMNGVVHGTFTKCSKSALETLRIERKDVLLAWNITMLALFVIARYGVAEACNQSFKANISQNYVHIGTVLHAVMSPCILMAQPHIAQCINDMFFFNMRLLDEEPL